MRSICAQLDQLNDWPSHAIVPSMNSKYSTGSKTVLLSIYPNKLLSKRKFSSIKLAAMNALRNKVQLIGNLGNAPEIKSTETGKKLARFSIATNETFQNIKGEKVTETTWHNLVAWGKVADLAEKFLQKGTEVVIEGKLINRSYNDKDGNKKYISEVQVNELLLLGAKEKIKE